MKLRRHYFILYRYKDKQGRTIVANKTLNSKVIDPTSSFYTWIKRQFKSRGYKIMSLVTLEVYDADKEESCQ